MYRSLYSYKRRYGDLSEKYCDTKTLTPDILPRGSVKIQISLRGTAAERASWVGDLWDRINSAHVVAFGWDRDSWRTILHLARTLVVPNSCVISRPPVFFRPSRRLLTILLTPWNRVLLEKLLVRSASQKYFLAFYRTQRFITVFASAWHSTISWARWIQFIPSDQWNKYLV
jgi:hypothetical protein